MCYCILEQRSCEGADGQQGCSGDGEGDCCKRSANRTTHGLQDRKCCDLHYGSEHRQERGDWKLGCGHERRWWRYWQSDWAHSCWNQQVVVFVLNKYLKINVAFLLQMVQVKLSILFSFASLKVVCDVWWEAFGFQFLSASVVEAADAAVDPFGSKMCWAARVAVETLGSKFSGDSCARGVSTLMESSRSSFVARFCAAPGVCTSSLPLHGLVLASCHAALYRHGVPVFSRTCIASTWAILWKFDLLPSWHTPLRNPRYYMRNTQAS